ncbi:MAG TPA: glycoside hydrolase [Terriglobales bacterium]|nr:glycoside hydrolase [Terriglobales bacterium]
MIRLARVTMFAAACLTLFALAATSVAQQIPISPYQQMRWRMIGPFRGGRTRAATGVPGEPNVFYIGQGDGGVWKSDDYGRTWNPIFDGAPTQSIGAIAVAASDPNIIYVGSGEGLHRPDLSVGDGIYKSTDGGKSWTNMGLPDSQQIPGLAVDPHDPNRVFAAVLGHPYGPSTERGIYRSTDGGQNWQRVLYKDENTGGCDIEMDPSNPNVLYACMWEAREGPWEDNNEFNGTAGGLFKSSDGGNTWQQLSNGLPRNLVQVNVAIAPSQPSRLYATMGTTEPGGYESAAGLGFYRSDDSGQTWYEVTKDARPAMRIGGGDLPIPRVDPKNPDVVYSASLVTVRSTDGGKTWTSLRGAPGGDDYQNLWISPDNSNVILLVSDQGAIVTVNGGQSWSSWYNQPTAQLYHVAVSNDFPYKVCSGQQESGSVCTLSRGNDGEITFRDWRPVGIIEYGYAAPDPLDPDIVYGAGRTEVSRFHWSTGQVENVTPIPLRSGKYRADRTQPVMFSPLDPHTMYYAANVLFKTTDGGHSWQIISPDLSRQNPGTPASVGKLVNPKAGEQRGVIYSLAPSFKNVNTIWAGTDDGQIWITRDGGQNWSNITPPQLTPWSKVTQLDASRFDDQTAYASVSRFRINDLKPYIFRTHDGGKSWELITTGLPDNAPADTVREDPVRKGLLFAGTESGVYVSFDDGDHWQSLQLNLPHSSMRDLWIHDDDLIVATHGRSFWILDDISPLRQLTPEIVASPAHLFQPAPAYRVRRSTYTDTPLPPDEPAGQNPPDGAIIDYYLAQPASGAVTLEILDAQGKVVRRYASTDKPEPTEEQLRKQLIPLYWIQMPQVLSAAAGAHRWVWNLHYTTPLATHYSYPISAVPHDTPRVPQGPRAVPGQYTVRLTVDGKTYTAPLTVKMDPRVKTPPAGLEQQFQMETRLASMMTQAAEAVLQARSADEQLHKLTAQASGPAKNAIAAFENELNGVLGKTGESPGSATPATLTRVNGDVVSLYGDVDRADAAPTVAETSALAETERNFASVMQRWNALKNTDLPALNRRLRGAGLTAIELRATAADDAGGEE